MHYDKKAEIEFFFAQNLGIAVDGVGFGPASRCVGPTAEPGKEPV
jgi:hypothetical protein